MNDYSNRIKKQGRYDLSFEPKSFWEYSRGSRIDKLIEDTKSFDHTQPMGKGSKFYMDELFGKSARSVLSKFNSEYAKRIIEMWSKKGDGIIDPLNLLGTEKIVRLNSAELPVKALSTRSEYMDQINDLKYNSLDAYSVFRSVYFQRLLSEVNDTKNENDNITNVNSGAIDAFFIQNQ